MIPKTESEVYNMKRIISLLLACAMLLSLFALPAAALDKSPAAVWNAKEQAFFLKDGPTVTRILADSNEYGTRVNAYVAHTDDFAKLGDLYQAAFQDDDRLFADAAGLDFERGVSGNLEVGVQLAYSFDGVNWVNDFDLDMYEDRPVYYMHQDFDLDEDDYREYYNLPNENCALDQISRSIDIFDGRGSYMVPFYCSPEDGMSIKQALAIRNNAILQGRGEFTGSAYTRDDANGWKGFMVDFNKNTLYVKARYRVYSYLSYVNAEGDWTDDKHTAIWSDWGPVKTYNNKTSSIEKQDSAPDMRALKTDAAPTLKVLSYKRYDIERDGVEMKATEFRLSVSFPAATKAAMAKFDAIDDYDDRTEFTGEGYDPHILYEIKVGNGDWFELATESFNNTFYDFCDDTYWIRDKMEALGYKPGDPVYLRARLYGSWSSRTEKDEATGEYKVYDEEKVSIKSGVSKPVELNLTGKFKVNYELNGGSFPYGTTQMYMFDETTNKTVDLTAKDYTPEYKHHTFGGWFTTEDFAKGSEIKSFNTEEKASRTYYAKWTELPFHTVSYDMGIITDYVFNPNVDRVYTDDGEVKIDDVSYESAKFLGWYDAAEGGSKVTSLSYGKMKKDVTLYARWQLPTKKISYSGAGKDYTNDTRNPATYQINPDGANTVSIYAPERRGFIFDGWFLNKDLTNGALAFDKEKGCYVMNESEDVTLYAKWIRGRWDIKYELNLTEVWNGGNPENYTYGTAVKLADPTRTGYTFNGWYADAAFKTKIAEIKADDVGEKTVYAKWTAIQYKINYDLRDPDAAKFLQNDNPVTRTVDDEVVLKPLTPKTRLYKFLGWYDNVNFDGEPFAKIAAGTDKDVTVYASLYRYNWGDVDFKDGVTAADARLVLRAAVGLEDFTEDQLAWGDIDNHSAAHEINAADARLVLRMAVELDTAESLKLPETPIGF